jgi:cytochrome P450
VLTGPESEQILADADRAAADAADYFVELIHERAAHPQGDILSELAPLAVEAGQYSSDEIASTMMLLMAAGFETTRYTITGGLHALAESPEQWALAREQVRSAGVIAADMYEELLRHQGPIHGALARRSAAPEVFDGIVIPPGEAVVPMLAAANRDPRAFTDPERLDITRPGGRPLSFGAGAHYCLGVWLARDEIILAVSGVVARFAGLEVLAPPAIKGSFNVRGPKGLQVRTH